jgi:hypothetical protein
MANLEMEAVKDALERNRVMTEQTLSLLSRHIAGEDVRDDLATAIAEMEITGEWFQRPN